jgi:hypothetical protein
MSTYLRVIKNIVKSDRALLTDGGEPGSNVISWIALSARKKSLRPSRDHTG